MDVDIKSEIEETDSLLEGDFSCQEYDYSEVNVECGVEGSAERDGNEQFSNVAGNFCKVCGDSATGMYFGALVCVPCKVGDFCQSFRSVYLDYYTSFLTQ